MSAAAQQASLDRSLRLLALACFFSMASLRWCDALVPVLSREFGGSVGEASRVVYVFAIAYGVMQLLFGPLGDRVGKVRVVCWACAVCALAAVASALAPNLGWLTAARVFHGAAAAGVIPLSMAWVGDQVPWDRRHVVMARQMTYTVTGMIAGQWLAGVFADTVGWRWGFGVLAIGFVAATVGLLRLQQHLAQQAKAAASTPAQAQAASHAPISAWARMAAVWQLPKARQVLVLVAIEGGFAFSAMAFAPTHLHDRLGLAVSMAGAIMVGYGLGGLLYSRCAHWILQRLVPLSMAACGAALVGASWLAMAWVPHTAWAPPLCMTAGLGFYMVHNTLQLRATQMAPAHRGTAVALFACALFLGQSVAMLVAAWVMDRWGTALVLSGCGAGLLAVAWAVRRLPTDPAPALSA